MRVLARLTYAFLVVALALCMATPANAQNPPSTGVRVRVLIYSGRPDPVFVLANPDSLRYLRTYLRNSKALKFERKTIIPATLGYKGLLLENVGRVAELPQRFAVSNGKIEVPGKARRVYADEGRTLERFLIQQAVREKAIDENLAKRLNIRGDRAPKQQR
jgi:hypothetical protein